MIKYSKGFKYVLEEDYFHICKHITAPTHIIGAIQTKYIDMTGNLLKIKEGFPWDGCSGPTIDRKTNTRAGLVHDGLYWLFREGYLPKELRPFADEELREICVEDGMISWWAQLYRNAVDKFGSKAASRKREILTAP